MAIIEKNKLNKEFRLPRYKRYKDEVLRCPCGCGDYYCDRDLVAVIIEMQEKIDEDLEFAMRPCCDDYARSVGELKTSSYAQGKGIELIRPFCIDTMEEFEELAISCGAIHTKINNADEVLYIDIMEDI